MLRATVAVVDVIESSDGRWRAERHRDGWKVFEFDDPTVRRGSLQAEKLPSLDAVVVWFDRRGVALDTLKAA